MSNMLEQAIVDAEALKEAALQNAEQSVIEKYQAEIKNAVESLLEQDEEDPFEDPLEEPLGDEDGLESSDDLAQQMPLASTEGDKLCPCPDEEEEVEIDFDQLAQQMQASDEDTMGGIPALDSPLAEAMEEDEEIEEEIQITEEELVDILEELTLDMEPTKAGWLQRPDSSVEHEIDILQTKVEEPHDVTELEEEKEDEDLSEALKTLENAENKIYRLEKKANRYKQMLLQAKDTLFEVNLQNAKLLYTNQTLVDGSLNERQKDKIVEAIMKSGSVEETKTIFEALQGTVGARPNNRKVAPKSLSEAVERRSTTLPRRVEKDSHSYSDRMKILAGINK